MTDLVRMPYGKHEGELIEDIPSGYLTWLLGNTNIEKTYPQVAQEAEDQLAMREGQGVRR